MESVKTCSKTKKGNFKSNKKEKEVKLRKIRKLSFFGVLGVVIAVLFLISISFTQAQVQTQGKPDKPGKPDKNGEEATWAVSLPTGGDTMLFGDGLDYIDGVNNIEVTVEKNSPGTWRRDNNFVTYIGFKISNPSDRYVDFGGVSLTQLHYGDYPCVEPDYGKPCSVFPPSLPPYDVCDSCVPSIMEDFLNEEMHPYTATEESTYRYFIIELRAFDKDILTMGDGESYLLGQEGHYHDYINITLRYQTGDRAPTYHNIDFSKSAHLGEASLNPFNIWITRTGENTWTVDVGTVEDPQFLFLEEYYYETIQRGKKIKLAGWYSTLYAGGNFHFTFDLIRIPPQ